MLGMKLLDDNFALIAECENTEQLDVVEKNTKEKVAKYCDTKNTSIISIILDFTEIMI